MQDEKISYFRIRCRYNSISLRGTPLSKSPYSQDLAEGFVIQIISKVTTVTLIFAPYDMRVRFYITFIILDTLHDAACISPQGET